MTDAREIIAMALAPVGDSATFTERMFADVVLTALHDAGIRILGPDEVDPVEKALEQALDLLNSSLREMAPISSENHRRRVNEFIANARTIGRKA